MQRYSQELLARIESPLEKICPRRPLQGVLGHLWEQSILPWHTSNRLLWSPANTGPLTVERQVLTIHDVASLDHPEWFESRFARWYGWMTPALVRRVRCVITVSEFSKKRLVANTGMPESRVEVIPNGVSQQFSPQEEGRIRDVRSRLKIPTDRYVLCVGSIEPRKNVSRLLEAWSLISHRLPKEVFLVVAGAAGKGHVFATTNLGKMPARVYPIGFVQENDLPALYSGALALVYPSLYEGFGLPVLEAMASGTAAIASETTALPEVTGDAALLIDPLDVTAIAGGIERVVMDDTFRKQLGQRGIERSRYFTWQRAATSTLRVLRMADMM